VASHRIGIDFGGSKIEIAVLAADSSIRLRRRVPTPATYAEAIAAVATLVEQAEREAGTGVLPVGIGLPGRIEPATGHVISANCLSGQPFQRHVEAALGRAVRLANDADCFALSEATDGAGQGARCVFGAVLGTGCGGGVVIDGRLLEGCNGVSAEWGHNPFAFEDPEELPGRLCWCGRRGCNETVLAGPALARLCDGPDAHDATGIARRAARGDPRAQAALEHHAARLARALGQIVNLIDPEVIVLGGGLSNMEHLYAQLPLLIAPYVFGGRSATRILRNRHGDSSGVRGAAWLWGSAEP